MDGNTLCHILATEWFALVLRVGLFERLFLKVTCHSKLEYWKSIQREFLNSIALEEY